MEPLPAATLAGPDARATWRSASTTTAWSRSPSTSRPIWWRSASRPTPPGAPTRSPANTAGAACPVVMGGFHATPLPGRSRVATPRPSSSGEAEALWPRVIDDCRHGRLRGRSTGQQGARRSWASDPDRSIFAGKRYLPVGLVEAGRGCHFSATSAPSRPSFARDPDAAGRSDADPGRESRGPAARGKLFFFVDDNITSNLRAGQGVLPRARSRSSSAGSARRASTSAHDEEFLDLLRRSGCQGVLIGFESR